MIRLIPRVENSKLMILLSPVLALSLTAITAYFIFISILVDIEVSSVFYTLFVEPLTDSYYLSELLVKAAPLMIIALGLSIGFKAGVWNIGAEGQYVIGGIAGSAVGLYFYDVEGFWIMPLMVLSKNPQHYKNRVLQHYQLFLQSRIDLLHQYSKHRP